MTHIVIMLVLLVLAVLAVMIDLRRGKKKEQQSLASAPAPPAEELVPDEPRQAVLVEHNPVMRLTIKRELQRQAYDVVEARDGQEALARLPELTSSPPAIVVLVDSGLPEMGGIDLVRTLRADPAYDGLRIVMRAPDDDADDLAATLDDEAVRYLRKPFTTDKLLATLE